GGGAWSAGIAPPASGPDRDSDRRPWLPHPAAVRDARVLDAWTVRQPDARLLRRDPQESERHRRRHHIAPDRGPDGHRDARPAGADDGLDGHPRPAHAPGGGVPLSPTAGDSGDRDRRGHRPDLSLDGPAPGRGWRITADP